MKKEINLSALFDNNFDCYTNFDDKGIFNDEPAISKEKFKEICLNFSKQLLELAAENALIDLLIDEENDIVEEVNINKQSILDTIKQIKI